MLQNLSPITISKTDARRFMLAHHGLYPPRKRNGKAGILEYIRHVNSIQFDPINIVGRNPDLVLQSRVKDYRPGLLDELLYQDRQLLDGWDKMASIYPLEDLPFFLPRRDYLRSSKNSRRPPQAAIEEVLAEVGHRGPLSSLDFEKTEKVDWFWGPTKIARACLEHLYAEGYLGIDHRVNNRRSFDLIERLLPEEILAQPDPHTSPEGYQDWHVRRRVGSLGLAHAKSGEYWLGILGVKSQERNAAIKRLTQQGEIVPIHIQETDGQTYYIRCQDLSTLEHIQNNEQPEPGAAFVAPLDNLTWNRDLIRQIFDFDYIWEVYKPKSQRQYGYYVLPVIYGDRFIARVDPAFDKKAKILTLQNWWWEEGVNPDDAMFSALADCLQHFAAYLEAEQVQLGKSVENEISLQWIKKIFP
jgi:uncharacterized protein YcaQ